MMDRLGRLLNLVATFTLALALAACGGSAGSGTGSAPAEGDATSTSTTDASATDTQATSADEGAATFYQVTNDDGFVNTLITDGLGEGTVTNEDEAVACVRATMERLGGNDSVELADGFALTNESGTTVYTFRQQAGGVLVEGAAVKLVVDKDGKATGIVSSIMPGVESAPIAEWAVDATQAEQVVAEQLRTSGSTATIVEGATEKAIVADQSGAKVCAWVVYTFQADAEYENGIYAANYVSAQGTYLYAMPVSDPGDADAQRGQSAKSKFDFDAYEPGEANVTIQHIDGTTEEVTVPVLKDAAAGKTYLADAERKILCADMASYYYDGGKYVPVEVGEEINQNDAHAYYTFIRVWDFFDSVGWRGPDGKGTPSLLFMNFVGPTGDVINNAVYLGNGDGFQNFSFTHAADYGECTDVIAHEFAHCLSATTLTGQVNKGDQGAISEGYSDVMGNIVEMELDDGDAWIFGDGLGPDDIARNMAEPHEYAQPEHAFDTYYAPRPPVATGMNDQGGAHINSSLLAILSYRLDQAGMPIHDQGYFWMNVALAMTPQSDYPMLAELLPWVMEQVGYDTYVEALKAAIDQAALSVTEDPGTIPEGCGSATFDFADIAEAVENGRASIVFFKAPEARLDKRATTWPMKGTTVAKANLPAGDYYVVVQVGDASGFIKQFMALGEDGWTLLDGKDSATIKAAATAVTVKANETTEIPTDGFKQVATEALELVDQTLAELDEG